VNRSVIDHLNAELATAFVLALNAKRYHWTVTGPHFRDYHLRFEDLYTAAEGTVDELAERIRMMGGVPIHAPAQIEAQTKAAITTPSARLDPEAMLKEALANEEATVSLIHEGI
jgi:starvation-inducible DNA-binding protein